MLQCVLDSKIFIKISKKLHIDIRKSQIDNSQRKVMPLALYSCHVTWDLTQVILL